MKSLIKNLSESILLEINNLMSDVNVIDICNSFSSRKNHLKYKIEGNSAIYDDGTIIKHTNYLNFKKKQVFLGISY